MGGLIEHFKFFSRPVFGPVSPFYPTRSTCIHSCIFVASRVCMSPVSPICCYSRLLVAIRFYFSPSASICCQSHLFVTTHASLSPFASICRQSRLFVASRVYLSPVALICDYSCLLMPVGPICCYTRGYELPLRVWVNQYAPCRLSIFLKTYFNGVNLQ